MLTVKKCMDFLANSDNIQTVNELMQETGIKRIDILKILLS